MRSRPSSPRGAAGARSDPPPPTARIASRPRFPVSSGAPTQQHVAKDESRRRRLPASFSEVKQSTHKRRARGELLHRRAPRNDGVRMIRFERITFWRRAWAGGPHCIGGRDYITLRCAGSGRGGGRQDSRHGGSRRLSLASSPHFAAWVSSLTSVKNFAGITCRAVFLLMEITFY